MPGLPEGKPAGLRCPHLTDDLRCALYDDPRRPQVCASFPARPDHCGASRGEALSLLSALEVATR
jgi:Fe-S-cluster containining protein